MKHVCVDQSALMYKYIAFLSLLIIELSVKEASVSAFRYSTVS